MAVVPAIMGELNANLIWRRESLFEDVERGNGTVSSFLKLTLWS
jgi:hypothetical protein